MPRQKKRALAIVDLLDDDDSSRQAKSSRFSSSQASAAPSSSYTPVYAPSGSAPTAPSSSFDASQRLSWQNPIVINDDGDEPSTQDLTQRDDGPEFEHYGHMDGKIVGVRYYNGLATYGELVLCRREPTNPYDSNAIRVDNVFGNQIGHIPRLVAAKLAPYIDRNEITIEGTINGDKGPFDWPIRIDIFGSSVPLARAQLEERLKKDRLVNATQLKQTRKENEQQRKVMGLRSGRGSAGFGDGKPEEEVSMEELTKASQAVNFRGGQDFVKSLAMDEDQLSKLPAAKQPEKLKATLLPYQLQGLAWLTAKENPQYPEPGSSDSVQLWKRDAKGQYNNVATNFTVKKAPALLSGGILADDMGLGKTIQIISLIMRGGPGSTLIVAPVSVMSNWEQQIQRHVLGEHMPKVIIYHGQSRQAAKSLKGYDVVITSYGTMSNEANSGGTLSKIDWRRIVLDEGHTIRNVKTKVAEAACTLKAQSRWVLTGTPIINTIKDLHSLLKFLRITGGIEQSEIFNTVLARPLANSDPRAEALLQSLMLDICLRRKKDMKFVDLKLPVKTEYVHRITFWPDEQKKYDALLNEAKGVLEEFQMWSKVGQKGRFQSVLERLLRLRQTCNHWTLCKERITDLLKLLEDKDIVELTEENRALLQQALQLVIESQEDCPVCFESLANPLITHCKHVFCRACITKVIEIQHKCPMCRAELSEDKLLEPAPEHSAKEEEQIDSETKSSKTEALLKILQATLKKDGSKVIIFSQWTSFLTVIQRQLDEVGYKYTRIDGSMNTAKRDAAMHALDSDPDTRIMVASLAVCSVGLNLVAADTVILADSWWAPAIEDQAIDRVHRLGQTRETTVWRLVMEGTVEERVLNIQAEKRELVGKAFQEKQGGKKKTKETRMADILKLLG
ncbi:putative SWI/SNF-related matrix-associated actin-dependent regulator of chromatin subfamily A member 3-like 1 [Diplogelasinospora grovesii]|uniref:SWI/SNF-related matrix-associated actin-dependent regulator of chromatin subfamily A member 3-like 1 n=1 Tax=Diplogelasinospora grovesii TaxID=303347 RepID=A0AAN6N2Q3_9PEZI|nr:putative SWI/SNF-related matrix-associated actin-dependent regulator of chromatin subfamily A member 3-like 1 [Diplogelasinospora grovesii]